MISRLAILILSVAALARSAAAAAPPNVVVILADDLGFGDVGIYNPDRGRIPTPRIDALARDGMRFTDAHSASAVCSPTRYALLTGRYPWRTRLQAGIVGVWERPLIAADRPTIATLARARGYRTACVGKWHLGWDWPIPPSRRARFGGVAGRPDGPEREATPEEQDAWRAVFGRPIPGGPTTRGFDTYFGTDVPNWPPYCFIEDDRTVGIPTAWLPRAGFLRNQASLDGPALPGWDLAAVLPALVDRACGFIRRASAETAPFLLYLPLTAPHTPIAVADDWKGKSAIGHPYADFVMQTDDAVGRVLDSLAEAGVAGDTLVIFTSDNGCAPYIGAKELEARGHFPSGPLRGYKADAWEGGHRIPFVVRWPGVVRPGSTCDRLVGSVDLFATLADLLGRPDAAARGGEDSVSLIPLLRGEDRPVRASIVAQSSTGIFAVREGDWKLIVGPGSGPPDGRKPHLYRLSDDLGETRDLAGSEPERAARLERLLDAIVADGRSTAGPRGENDVPVVLRKPPRPAAKAKAAAKRAGA